MYNYLFILIIIFLVAEFGVTTILGRLNSKYMRLPIPLQLEGLYDDTTYEKQQAYVEESKRIGRIERVLTLAITIIVLFTGFFGWFDSVCNVIAGTPFLSFLMFMGVGMVIMTVISLPFNYYSTFVVEEKYGFNKTTHATFWADQVKGLLLSAVLLGIILSAVYLLYEEFGVNFWIFALLFVTVIYIFFGLFYSNLIVPLFNKQTPLEDGVLRHEIEALAKRVGFSVKNIYIINGSKHSTKANAYFAGLGKMKRVVLYDTLIEQLTTKEITAVLAHEFGHCKHNDVYKQMGLSIAYLALNFYLFSLLVNNPDLSIALGGSGVSFALSLLAFGMLYTPIDMFTSPFINGFSRKAEYAADRFATNLGYGDALISGLKKLTANTLTPLTLHPWYVKFYLSHPILLQRMNGINNIKE